MRILSFDIESCTGNPADGSLCSFGYVLSEDFNIIEKGDILVNPMPDKFKLGKKGEEPKIKLAYSEKEFRSSPKFPEVYDKIKKLFDGEVLCIGFAIGNDVKYLNNACASYGLDIIEYKFCDVQMLVGFFNPENAGQGLGKLGEKYGITFTEHKSEDDAFVTLKLLEVICKNMGKTIKELLDYYEIVLGENNKSGFINTYSLAQLYNKKGLKRSKAQSGILLHEFLEELNSRPKTIGKLSGKRICFDSVLEKEDINYSRRLISKIYQLGGKYTADLTVANTFVKSPNVDDDARLRKVYSEISAGRRIKIISEDAFKAELGEIPELKFDDITVLARHSREKQLKKSLNKKREKEYKKVKRPQ